MATHILSSFAASAPAFSSVHSLPATGWRVKHLQHDGTLIDIVKPENLRFTFNKKAVHTISYEYSHSQGVYHDFVGAYRTDFELWYNPQKLMAGMHVPALDTTRGSAFSTINGKDWKHYLERRHYPFDPLAPNTFLINGTPPTSFAAEYAATDVTVIMKDILDQVLAMPYSLGMTYPVLLIPIGITTNFQLSLADTSGILTYIDSFSELDPGFVYEVTPDKEFVIYCPYKYNIGVATSSSFANYVFDSTNMDEIIEGPSFVNNGPAYTHLLAVGDGIGQVRLGAALGAPAVQQVYRRLDGTENYSDVKNLADVHLRAMKDFSVALNPQHEIEMTVKSEMISNFWNLFTVGSAIWVDSELESHPIQSGQEIVMMDCTVDPSGSCTVKLGLNQIYTGTAGVNQA